MRKTIAVILTAGLIGGVLAAAPAEAKKKKPKKTTRTAEGNYLTPALIVVGGCSDVDAVGCVQLSTTTTESYVTAEVVDAHGQPVFVSIQADTNGDAQDDAVFGNFCGKTSAPISVAPGTALHFWVGITADPAAAACNPGAATQGTLTATFSNMP